MGGILHRYLNLLACSKIQKPTQATLRINCVSRQIFSILNELSIVFGFLFSIDCVHTFLLIEVLPEIAILHC